MAANLGQPEMRSNNDVLALRAIGIGAAFGAAWLAGRVAGGGGLAAERRMEAASSRAPTTAKAASYALTSLAYPVVYLPLSFWIASALAKRGARSAKAVPHSALAAWATHRAAKSLVARKRPPSEHGRATDDRSYPSGHATAAAAIAMAAACAVASDPDQRAIVRLAIGLPALIGASRVVLGRHWPSDVIGGWATGVAVASYVSANSMTSKEKEVRADA